MSGSGPYSAAPRATRRVLGCEVAIFVEAPDPDGEYDAAHAPDVYRNFLRWLYATFQTDEASFRQAMIARLHLRPGDRLLITGCGLGDDNGE